LKKNISIGFIGLGNLGSKLAHSLLRNGIKTYLNDINQATSVDLISAGGIWQDNPNALAKKSDIIITCLPSPEISSKVIEGKNGVLEGLSSRKIWLEMSTTTSTEVARLSKKLSILGVRSADCPVSGGCHRAASGNISIFAGCERETFEIILPILRILGKQILHTGKLGTASDLKVMTNFLATTHLLACCEALTVMKAKDIDLKTTFEAIRISSGNSFVHETESQVILNGSRDINFTLGLVLKDIGIFQEMAESNNVPLELSPLINRIIENGVNKLGAEANSPSIIELLEKSTGLKILSSGFPEKITDLEPESFGYEIKSRI